MHECIAHCPVCGRKYPIPVLGNLDQKVEIRCVCGHTFRVGIEELAISQKLVSPALPALVQNQKENVMENELIPITAASIGGDQQQGVNARDLHAFLEVKTAFKDWIARRIEDFDFKEDSDFCSFLSESSGGRPSKEYVLTLNMAKELSMVERNEKGKQARQYFIQCEKLAKDPVNALLAMSKSEILMLAAETQKKNEALEAKNLQLENKIEEDAPKVEMAKRAIETDGAWLVRKVAKVLGVTQTFLFDFMHQKKILSPRNEPYAKFVQMGVIRPRISSYPDGYGNMRSKITAYVTARGIEYLIARLLKDGILKDRSCIQYELLNAEG